MSVVLGPGAHAIDFIHLRGMAIRAINDSIQDPVKACSDATIGGVMKMAVYESLFGDTNAYVTHMTGLQKMVMLRGGLGALGLDGLLERMLLWIDANTSSLRGYNVFFDKARFPTSVVHPKPTADDWIPEMRRDKEMQAQAHGS